MSEAVVTLRLPNLDDVRPPTAFSDPTPNDKRLEAGSQQRHVKR